MFNSPFLENMHHWYCTGETFALITIISQEGSAPFLTGTMMIVNAAGKSFGSISMGCIEATIYELALHAIQKQTTLIESFAPDDNPFAPQLHCGGSLILSIEAISRIREPDFGDFIRCIMEGKKVYRIWSPDYTQSSQTLQNFSQAQLDTNLSKSISMLENKAKPQVNIVLQSEKNDITGLQNITHSVLSHISTDVSIPQSAQIIAYYPPKPLLLIIGANEYSSALSTMAYFAGFSIEICDPRPVFAQTDQFPYASRVVCQWPQTFLSQTIPYNDPTMYTAICILIHDDKIDINVLEYLFSCPDIDHSRMYIGALGSHHTTKKRDQTLQDLGINPHDIDKIHSPIGIDIGGITAAETAVSILGEIIHHRRKSGQKSLIASLSDTHAPIHI